MKLLPLPLGIGLALVGLPISREFAFIIQDFVAQRTGQVDEGAALLASVAGAAVFALFSIPLLLRIFYWGRKESDEWRSSSHIPQLPRDSTSGAKTAIAATQEACGEKNTPIPPNVLTLFEYNSAAADSWARMQNFPLEQQNQFLTLLASDVRQDIEILERQVLDHFRMESKPFDDVDANKALARAKAISLHAAKEFERVYSLLGPNGEPWTILQKIEERYGPSEETVKRAGGKRLTFNQSDLDQLENTPKISETAAAGKSIHSEVDANMAKLPTVKPSKFTRLLDIAFLLVGLAVIGFLIITWLARVG